MFNNNEPASIQPHSQSSNQDQDLQLCVENIISKNKQFFEKSQENDESKQHQRSQRKRQDEENQYNVKELQELQLEMLVEECQDLIGKISPGLSHYFLQEEPSIVSEIDESFSMKKQKNRLEKQYIDLCLEIERQQKELHNYKFKVQVAKKEAEYYTRQIKQKTSILENLESHAHPNVKKRTSTKYR